MTDTKSFPTGAVLSTITGKLVSGDGMAGIYLVLNWMTGEDVYTHQLPRISREARPVIVAMHPDLQQAIEEAGQVTPANWRAWLNIWEARYGAEIAVPKFSVDEHERIDPLSELAEKVHPDRIVPVVAGRR